MLHRLKGTLFALYYWHNRLANRVIPSITLDGRKLRVLPTVYKPLDNEQRLVDWIGEGKTVLDVGCGSGVLTVFAALKSEHVTAVDINPEAVENTRLNCEAHAIRNATIKVSDMYSAVDDRFDYIISYPPLFRAPFISSHQQWCTSTYFVDELFKHAREHLRPDGQVVVMLPKAYQPTPKSFGEKNGLILESVDPQQRRALSIVLHSIPYLHLSLNLHVYTFREDRG